MNPLSSSLLLGTLAFVLAACDKPKEAMALPPPPPPPGLDGKFADPAAMDFLTSYKAYAQKVTEALEAGDPKKFLPLIAQGQSFAAQLPGQLQRVTAAELPQFQAQIAECAKPFAEMIKKQAPGAAEKFKAAVQARMEAAKQSAAERAAASLKPAEPATETTLAPPAATTPVIPALPPLEVPAPSTGSPPPEAPAAPDTNPHQ